MSGPRPGFLATYNSLTDKHLAGYFSNTRIRRHLQRSGLISRSGRIVSEKEYQLNAMRRDHQRYVQECLAHAIFHKVLDMERHHQLEIKRKLENSVRKERVQKIKVEQFRRLVEDASPMRSPHPPLGPRNRCGFHSSVAGEPAGRSQLRAPGPVVGYNGGHPSHQHQSKEPAFSKVTSWRPNTAPGNTQHPHQLQPLRSCAAVGSVPKTSRPKQKRHTLEHDQQFAVGAERSGLRLMNSVEYVTGISPYQLPVINSYMIPVPPPPLHKGDKSINAVRNGMPRGRRFRPTTAPNDVEQPITKNAGGFPKSPLRSNAFVTMVFLGKSVHLSHDDADYRDEIKVYQQHCGGENLCVYKGKLLEGETFHFVSKRHHGFPFSLTFFLNGIQVDRLSCCCEYKHQKRSRLGGRHGYFGFLNVEGASPCYRCIIAMGLDKKPSPPKRKMEEDYGEKHVGPCGAGVHSEPSKSSFEQKSSIDSEFVILPGHEASVETIEDKTETRQEYKEEERKKLSDRESEDSQEDTGKNEYDEDFEAVEEVNEEGQTGDQMNEMSKSSSDDKKHNLNYEKESKTSSQKSLQASDSEKGESGGYSVSDSEDDKRGRRSTHSPSSISTQYSSEDDSHVETIKDNVKGKEDHDFKRASDNAAHAQYGNENGENELLRMEENQETSVLEKEGIEEAEKAKPEDLTAREDTGIFRENTMAIQRQSPNVNGELKQAESVESNVGEDGKKNTSTRRGNGVEGLLVPLESSMTQVEDSDEESPQSNKGIVLEDFKPVQEEIANAIGNDHDVNSEPESSNSHTDEEEENITSTECDAAEAPDGAFLAEATRALDVQKAAEQVVHAGWIAGERHALEKEGLVAEGGDARTEEAGEEMAWAGDLLPKEDTVAALEAEGQPAVLESAPEESAVAEDPRGKGAGRGMVSGIEVAAGWQGALVEGTESEAALGEQAPRGEKLAGALLGTGVAGTVCEQVEVAGGASEAEEAAGAAPEAGEAVRGMGPRLQVVAKAAAEAEGHAAEGGFAGQGLAAAVPEGEEAAEDASLAEGGIAGVVGPEGEEPVGEAFSEWEVAVEKPGALLETLGDANISPGAAVPGGQEGFVTSDEFSQLKAPGEEWMEVGKVAIGAATSESGETSAVEGSSAPRAEDVVVEPGGGPVWQVAPVLEAVVAAGGDPLSQGSPQLEETAAAEEGSAESLWSGNPSLGSEAKTDGAMDGQPDGGVRGVSAERARTQAGAGQAAAAGVLGPGELAVGPEGSPAEGVLGSTVLPAPGLRVSGAMVAGEVGGQAGRGAVAEAAAGGAAVAAGDSGLGAQEGVTGAACGGQGGTGAAAAGAAGESGRHREGLADGAVACGRGVKQEAALGCEGRGTAPAGSEGQGEVEQEWGTVRPVSPPPGEVRGAMSSGQRPIAETWSAPALGDGGVEPRGRVSAGGEGLWPGTQLQRAARGTGAVGGKDGPQEGAEQAGVKAEEEQPGLCENAEGEVASARASARGAAGVREPRKDSPVGGSAGTLAADAGERSRGPWEDALNPAAVVVPSVQPKDGEETLL